MNRDYFYLMVFDFQGIVIYTSTSLFLPNEEVAVNGQVTGGISPVLLQIVAHPSVPAPIFQPKICS